MRLPFLPNREPLNRRLPGGAYLGSLLWAASNLTVALLLWALGAYIQRPGIDPWMLLGPVLVMAVAQTYRRAAPGTALLVGTAAAGVDLVWLGPSASVWLVVYPDLLYVMVALGRRRPALVVSAIAGVVTVIVTAALGYIAHTGWRAVSWIDAISLFGLFALIVINPLVVGYSVREHRLRADTERTRAEQAVRMAELDRTSAVTEERTRMARDLHDVVANHLSAVAVQSTAALSLRDPRPEQVRQILTVIRENSVQGLAEMRRMIQLLRSDNHSDIERVSPSLAEVNRLVQRARAAGLDVDLVEHGTAGPLPAPVDATAYRIAQEALTNAMRYAHPPRAHIAVHHPRARTGPAARLVLTVENAHTPATTADHPHHGNRDIRPDDGRLGGGMGLTGMRERVELLGGTLRAGPNGDTWRIHAELPMETETPT